MFGLESYLIWIWIL